MKKLSKIADARVETDEAARHLRTFCERIKKSVGSRPTVRAHVEWSETRGSIDFGWGRCTLEAEPDSLAVRLQTDDVQDLEALRELVTRHLEEADLTVRWTDEAASSARGRRIGHSPARMRHFHRRARGG